LAEHSRSQSDLARLAGVNRSVISRFLEKDQPLSMATAIRLYDALKSSMGPAECQQWVTWLDLEGVEVSLGDPSTVDEATHSLRSASSNIETGYQWLSRAWNVLRRERDIPTALQLFAQAELAFGRYSTLAALAGCEIIQQYINLGYLARAGQEVLRVERAYSHVMDVQTQREFLQLKGMAAYDRQDYVRALQAVDELIVLEKTHGFHTMHQHIAGLSQLSLAERLDDANPEKQRLLGMAEENLRFMCRVARLTDDKMHVGFMTFRLAQAQREQGQHDVAARNCRLAQQCFIGDPALGHVRLEEANLALLDGETKRARARAEAATEMWLTIRYAGGLGRAAAVQAVSLWVEGRAQEALAPAVAAASIAPNGSCFKGWNFLDLPWQINRDVFPATDKHQYAALIDQMAEGVRLRSGHFSCLARVMPDRSGAALALLAKLAASRTSAPVWVV
jgi:transcriptional regulator with XRE-family HTH domain